MVQIKITIFACPLPAAAARPHRRLPLEVAPPRRVLGLGGLPRELTPPRRRWSTEGLPRELASPHRRFPSEGSRATSPTSPRIFPSRGTSPHRECECAMWWATSVLPAYVDSWLRKSRGFPVCRADLTATSPSSLQKEEPITQVGENGDEDRVICWLSSLLTETGGASVSVGFQFWPFPFKCSSIIIQNKFLHYSVWSQNKVNISNMDLDLNLTPEVDGPQHEAMDLHWSPQEEGQED